MVNAQGFARGLFVSYASRRRWKADMDCTWHMILIKDLYFQTWAAIERFLQKRAPKRVCGRVDVDVDAHTNAAKRGSNYLYQEG